MGWDGEREELVHEEFTKDHEGLTGLWMVDGLLQCDVLWHVPDAGPGDDRMLRAELVAENGDTA